MQKTLYRVGFGKNCAYEIQKELFFRGVASKEKRLSELKGIYSSMKRSDPKRLKYANRIQKLQKDLIATKSALSHQEEVVSEKPNVKKTSKKVRPVGSGTNGPTPKKSEKKKLFAGYSSVCRGVRHHPSTQHDST